MTDIKVPKAGKKHPKKKIIEKNIKANKQSGGSTCNEDYKKYFNDVNGIYTSLIDADKIRANTILNNYLLEIKGSLANFLENSSSETKCKDIFAKFLLKELKTSGLFPNLKNYIQSTESSIDKFIFFEATKDGKLNMKWTSYGINGFTGPFPDFVENFAKSIKAINTISENGTKSVEIIAEPSLLKRISSGINIAQLGNNCQNIYLEKKPNIDILEQKITGKTLYIPDEDTRKELFKKMNISFNKLITEFFKKFGNSNDCHSPLKVYLSDNFESFNDFIKKDEGKIKYIVVKKNGSDVTFTYITPSNLQNFWKVFIDDYISSLESLLFAFENNKEIKEELGFIERIAEKIVPGASQFMGNKDMIQGALQALGNQAIKPSGPGPYLSQINEIIQKLKPNEPEGKIIINAEFINWSTDRSDQLLLNYWEAVNNTVIRHDQRLITDQEADKELGNINETYLNAYYKQIGVPRMGGDSKPVLEKYNEKYKYKNKKYKIRIGPKGGKYILVEGVKIRI